MYMNVWYGSNENRWLSNLAYRPFWYKGKYFITVEMCYQSWKSGEFDASVYNKKWREGLKIIGKKGTKTDNNWNVNLMEEIMLESFRSNPEEYESLRRLRDVKFTHIQDKGIWKNMFPTLLKRIKNLD